MNTGDIQKFLHETSEDGRLSRSEKSQLKAILEGNPQDDHQVAALRHAAFDVARGIAERRNLDEAFAWLNDVLNTLDPAVGMELPKVEAHFSPGTACLDRVCLAIAQATSSLDICVYTITHNPIREEIRRAYRDRWVKVRIIAEQEKADDDGADVRWLAKQGVPVVFDTNPGHMHHKFAIVDGQLLVNGSFNWTRSATEDNNENIIVTDDRRLITVFAREFERLWERYSN